MEIHLERYKGPSKLDDLLEQYRDSESGRVIVTPEEAREVLLDRLLGFLKAKEGEIPAKIEVLVRIAEMPGDNERFDYTETLESVKRESAEARKAMERVRREMRKGNIITSRNPRQPEI